MTDTVSVHRPGWESTVVFPYTVKEKEAAGVCTSCFGGFVYEPTEDSLEDEAHICWMCKGKGRV